MALAIEQQMQKVLEETQLDMNEFDNLLQPIIDTCTKDAISVSDVNLSSSLVVLWAKDNWSIELLCGVNSSLFAVSRTEMIAVS